MPWRRSASSRGSRSAPGRGKVGGNEVSCDHDNVKSICKIVVSFNEDLVFLFCPAKARLTTSYGNILVRVDRSIGAAGEADRVGVISDEGLF